MESGQLPLELTDENYGRVPRYYIECSEDKAVTPYIQRLMHTEIPCKKVYIMATSHSPFFSGPAGLTDILLDLALD